MKIPESPKNFDPLRIVRHYPVDRIESVEIDNDGTFEIVFDCLDRGPQEAPPGFENQPTQAVLGMTRENAEKLVGQLTAALAEGI
jgi:hypothetical protein